jgi:hypothetical protein
MSSRIFLLDRRRFTDGTLRVPLCRPNPQRTLRAFLYFTPPVRPLEECLSTLMAARGLRRVDFLGTGPGLWCVHPRYRSPRFYTELASIIGRLENGDVPAAQRGDYELNESMIDWSDVSKQRRSILPRLKRALVYTVDGVSERVHAMRLQRRTR